MSAKAPFTEAEVIRRLKALEGRWPDHLTLFSWFGHLHLLRTADIPENGSGSYHDATIARFPGIINDGGDPE